MTATPPWLPIRTERLILRDVRESDFDDIHAYATDPETVRYMLWGPNTLETTREVIDRWLARQTEWPRQQIDLVVELQATGRVIGVVSIHDATTDQASIGYCYHSAYWRRGYGTEAARAMAALAFGALALRRLSANCDARNRGSYRVMEKLGMRREGHFRQDVKVRDGWRDSYHYAILAEEWILPGQN